MNNVQPVILLIDSSYPINTRNERILSSLEQNFLNIPVYAIAWNRDERSMVDSDRTFVYNRVSEYGSLFKKLCNLIGYFHFIKKYNKKLLPKIIIASHWDMLLLAVIMRQKGQRIIYENLDVPTSGNNWLQKLLLRIEKWAVNRSDAMIVASRFFLPLYTYYRGKKFVIENKPLNIVVAANPELRKEQGLVISYIGLVRYIQILKNLVDAVRSLKNVTLYIHGEGQDLIALKEYAKDVTHVHFTGRYEGAELPALYRSADVVWAAYPNKDYNVKYAISNKYHESIAYQVPCIYSDKTCLGDWVKEKEIGIVVNPYSVNDIRNVLDNLGKNRSLLFEIQKNLSQYSSEEKSWSEQFSAFKDYLTPILS